MKSDKAGTDNIQKSKRSETVQFTKIDTDEKNKLIRQKQEKNTK